MKILPKSVEKLIEAFQKLPGIGPKTASRLTFYLLHVPQVQLDQFSDALKNLKIQTVYCSTCFNIGEDDPCVICTNPGRDNSIICVVEKPIDILAIEKAGKFNGVYHVLQGAINPLDNIGPDELKIAELLRRVKPGKVKEVILATNTNMEGEATAMYIRRELLHIKEEMIHPYDIIITRIAHGLPIGADIEYTDEITLTKALENRKEY